jgi:hypothetical protein
VHRAGDGDPDGEPGLAPLLRTEKEHAGIPVRHVPENRTIFGDPFASMAVPRPIASGAAAVPVGTLMSPAPVTLIARCGEKTPQVEPHTATSMLLLSSVTAPVSARALPERLASVVMVTLMSVRM